MNYNGMTGDSPISGFNDWQTVNLQQMGARAGAFGFSAAGGLDDAGGGLDDAGGGLMTRAAASMTRAAAPSRTRRQPTPRPSPPTGLTCSISQNNVPGYVSSRGYW